MRVVFHEELDKLEAAQKANEYDMEGHAQKAKDLLKQVNDEIKLAAEGIRVGRALGYQLEKVRGIEPDVLLRADEGDKAANDQVESVMIPKGAGSARDNIQRPSMAQDIIKGRRTEIEQMNGLIARKGAEIGAPAPSHEKLTAVVLKVERGEARPSPSLLA